MEIEKLLPAQYNPRKDLRPGDPEYEKLKKSIQEFDYVDPIIWNERTGRMVGGHQRLKILRELGWQLVEVSMVDLPEEREKALNLALNKTGGEWDQEMLKDLLEELNTGAFDIEITGFDEKEIEELMTQFHLPNEVVDDNFDTDAEAEKIADPITKKGDIWLLGQHRLMCGDSTNIADVKRLMDGKRAILFATDPPYLVDYDGTNHPHKWNASPDEIKQRNKDWSETYGVTWDDSNQGPQLYEGFIRAALECALLENAAWYCWHASRNQSMVESVWNQQGAFVHQQIIWAKDRPVLTRCHYMWQHEPCFFGWIKGKRPPRVAKDYPSTVWTIPTTKPGVKTEHPTSKPIEIFAVPIQQHMKKGEVCYEPFSGSGSQIMAAEMLDVSCFAMEIEPVYCDVAVKRWEQFTGKKALQIK